MFHHENEEPGWKELNAISDLLSVQKLFDDDNNSLNTARDRINDFEKHRINFVSQRIKSRFYAEIYKEYNACLALKKEISKRLADLEKKEKNNWSLPSFYKLRGTSYIGGVISIDFQVTDWYSSGADPYVESFSGDRKVPQVLSYLRNDSTDKIEVSEDEANHIVDINERTLANELDNIRDLLSDNKLDYEKANEKINQIQFAHNKIISFKNKFKLNDLIDRSRQVENDMLRLIQKIDAVEKKQEVGFQNLSTKADKVLSTMREQDEISKKNQEQIKQKIQGMGQQLGQQLSEARKEQLEQSKALSGLDKKANEIKQSVADANGKLQDVRKEQEQHARSLSVLDKKAEEIKTRVNEANTKLQEVKQEQTRHAQALSGLDKKAEELKNSVNDANTKLQEVKKEQVHHAHTLSGLDKKADELKSSVNEANTKLQDVKQEQARHMQTLSGLDKKAEALKISVTEGNSKLQEVRQEQTRHTQALAVLDKVANELKNNTSETNTRLQSVSLEQKQHRDALTNLDKKAEDIKSGVNQANAKLVETRQDQKKHTEALAALDKKADEIKVSANDTSVKLSEIKQEQKQHTQAIASLDKKADELKSGVSQANGLLQEVRKEQTEHTKTLTGLDKKADELKSGVNEANHRLIIVNEQQAQQNKKLDTISQHAVKIQQDVTRANTSLEEMQRESTIRSYDIKKRTNGLISIGNNSEYIHAHESFLQEIDRNFNSKNDMISFIYSDNMSALHQLSDQVKIHNKQKMTVIKTYYYDTQRIYEALVKDYKDRKEMRDRLFLKMRNDYNECLQAVKSASDIGFELSDLEEYLESLSKMLVQNSDLDNKDSEKLNDYYNKVIKENINKASALCDLLSKNKKQEIEKVNKYLLCEKASEMRNVKLEHINQIKLYDKEYKDNRDKNIDHAIKSLDNEISYILKLADASKNISKDFKQHFEDIIKCKEALLLEKSLQEFKLQFKQSYEQEKSGINNDADTLIIAAKTFHYEAKQLMRKARICRESGQHDRFKQLLNSAKDQYQFALKKYQLAKGRGGEQRILHELDDMIVNVSNHINNIETALKNSDVNENDSIPTLSNSRDTFFSQTDRDPTINISTIQKQQEYDGRNNKKTI